MSYGLFVDWTSVYDDCVDDETEETLLCLHALSSRRQTVMLHSTDNSASLSSMLSAVMSTLIDKLQFSVRHGCCVCAQASSPLYLTRVRAAATLAGHNLHQLHLTAR